MENAAKTSPAPTGQKYGNTTTDITRPNPQIDGKYISYGVIFWPTDTATRRTKAPAVVLFAPGQ